jgi:hypothetical protein
MTEKYAGGFIGPHAFCVRSTMRDHVVHPSKDGDVTFSGKPCNPTHFRCPSIAGAALVGNPA